MSITVGQNRKLSIRKTLNFPDYWEFPVPADENGLRIWIVQCTGQKKNLIAHIISENSLYPENSR